jgi:cytochrome c biogenesis protein CcmG, thiol:disulfide interchange protein DsbE
MALDPVLDSAGWISAARCAVGDVCSLMRRWPLLVGALLLAILIEVQAQTRFEGEGRVVAVDEAKGTVTLDHGPIGGLMSAMQMEFPADPVELLRGLRVGDAVRFTLQARGAEWVVASVARAARGAPAQAVSLPAPDFTLPTLAGGSVRLSDLRGRVVLLNFWATWCVPCRTEMPAIEELYQRYRDRGLEVLAINLDVLSTASVEAFAKEVGVTFRVALDPSWSTARAYSVIGLPTTYLIDRSGKAVVREVGAREWTDGVSRMAVEGLLHESAASKDR